MRVITISLLLLVAVVLMAIFVPKPGVSRPTLATPLPPTPTPVPGLNASIEAGLRFLKSQYNPNLGLLQESPRIGAHRYFLANDALLARHVFRVYGEHELAERLGETLSLYRISGNDFIEVAWGEVIPWPPKHFEDPGSLVETRGENQILTIRHEGPGYFSDWSGYSNLAFMAVHNELNGLHLESARRLYMIEMGTFDGRGFPDLAYLHRNGVYETLGLAWGAYAAARLGVEADPRLVDVLLAQQDPETGGFHTHYRADTDRLADPNVETTSIVLLWLALLDGREVVPRGPAFVPNPGGFTGP